MEALPLVLIVVAFYFLLIRPQRNRARAAVEMQENLAPGREVMTSSGLFGTVVAVEDDGVVLEVAPGVRTRWVRGAIARVVPENSADPVDPAAGRPPDDTPNGG